MKTKNRIIMTTMFVLAFFLGVQLNTLHSNSNFNESTILSNEVVLEGVPASEINNVKLAPVTPKEADFEDEKGIENMSATEDLSPVTPDVAEFEEPV